MSDELKINRLAKEDIDVVYNVFAVTIPDTFLKENITLPGDLIKNEIELKKRLLDESIEGRGIFFLVAKLGELVVGTVSYGPCGEDIRKCTNSALSRIGELGSLFILPEYQGMGIGSLLIKKMVSELSAQGIKRFCLDSGYKLAQKKWRRKFGEPYMTVKDYWGPGYDHMIWLCKVRGFI
ncbi:MAG: Acetyltransferase (GNAT) family protein [Firmicutes bacterium ADurb.Bin182]|nr:MAG: Acetyltransferase (GNAT) family protein [Firmicutes bacterium ADurb.Bin182]